MAAHMLESTESLCRRCDLRRVELITAMPAMSSHFSKMSFAYAEACEDEDAQVV